jgi:hypothetical protein
MAIKEKDIKLLWGRAAGICSKPDCNNDLTAILSEADNYVVGEMAHIIAQAEGGPRGRVGGGSDTYENLILLCPTCHRHVDKAPRGQFTEEMLLDWKQTHETALRQKSAGIRFEDFSSLCASVSQCMEENWYVWKTYGPKSEIAEKDPSSNAVSIWDLRKLSTIVPNNRSIINMITSNTDLLTKTAKMAFIEFKDHAEGFERNQYGRLDHYKLFPQSFAEEFNHE